MKLKFILLISSLLMLSSCVLPAEYGVSRTTKSGGSQLKGDNELKDMAEEYWNKYLCKKGESSFLKFDDSIYQVAGAKPLGLLLDTTPADNLNGIDATGVLRVNSVAHRYYSKGKWSNWSDDDARSWVSVYINKKNGKWVIEDNPKVQSMDCNSIPS